MSARVFINVEHPRGAYAARVLRTRAREFLSKLGLDAELSILLTTDEAIRRLNRDFRGIDRATDVLSFPAGDPLPGQAPFLGDLAISLDTARRRAREDGRPLSRELARYLAHGLLHLLGYDHEVSEQEARRMAEMEASLLGEEGMLGGEG
nr:MAG: rRNA maturation RNase YbeY [Pseudomonadota bacterium]